MYALVFVSIVAIACSWFVMHTIFEATRSVGVTLASDMGTDSSPYTDIDTFFQNVDDYMMVLMLLCVGFWAWQYSQRRGTQV